MKRNAALLIISLLLLITILPVSIYAEGEDTPDTPDVSVYATKEQMMDDTFAPNADGTAENIGIIEFGGNGNLQWYILGKDTGVNGENTVIFAVNNMGGECLFGDNNDYVNSEIRAKMNDMVNNNYYFTSAENSILNETPISDKINYKLYSLHADDIGKTIIKAGSYNQISIAMENYWNNTVPFWLRTPYNNTVMHAKRDVGTLGTVGYSTPLGVHPAANLNLSNVLFASAAKDGSLGPLNKEDLMLLRFDGSIFDDIDDKEIGEVSYDTNNIYVTVPGERQLFVQGRNGNQNWVYNVNIAAYGLITKDNIIDDLKGNVSLSLTDIDLSKCKIWIERKIDGLLYAVEAKEAISSVDISVEPPVAGYPLTTNAVCNTTGIDSTMPLITWYATDETAIYSKTYKASITLTPKTGYVFVNMYIAGELLQTSAAVKDSIKGENVKVEDVKVNEDGTLTVKFDLTAKDSIIGIEQPALTYENGTPIDEFKFPDKVKVTGYSGKEYQLVIFPWEAHRDNNYDPECKDEQTLVYLSGLKEIPDGLDYRNPDGPDVKLTITIKAAKTSNNTGGNHTVIIPDTSVR